VDDSGRTHVAKPQDCPAGTTPSAYYEWQGGRFARDGCRVTLSADSCVRQTERWLERYGPASLLVAKFIPGLARVAAPLAGALRVRLVPFLAYTSAGAALWAASGLALGLLLYRQIDWLLGRLAGLGALGLVLLAALLALYAMIKAVDRWRFLLKLRSARIGVAELYEMITRGDDPVILDVRSASHRKLDRRVIPGAHPMDPEEPEESIVTLARGREVIVYCACPNEATAFKVALALRRRGLHRVRPLAGGIDAWFDAVPKEGRAA